MTGKVVLITGCSVGGIGFAMCIEFAKRGCKVYATARGMSKMEPLGGIPNIELMALDITDDSKVSNIVKMIIEKEGHIDIVVNNAGMARFGPILEIPMQEISNVFETNVLSMLRVSRAVVAHMSERKSGLIVNICSVMGEIPTPWAGVYASSKAALHSASEVMQMECRPFNIKVMLVCPGGIKSNVAQNASTHFELQPSSLYQQYLPNIIKRMWSSQDTSSISAEEFAKVVAKKSLAPNPPLYLKNIGSNSMVFAILKWLPREWVLNLMWKLCTGPVNS
ncbi:NAD-P-binding protein [Mycena rebaudengoi]|nr:NAD-P-binding protein [Mycena rebaudengoi]